MGDYTQKRSDGCTVNGTLVDDKVDGAVIVTFPNGRQESVKYYSMNIPVGTHTTWDEEGEVVLTLKYENGEVVEVNGRPVTPGSPPDDPLPPPTPTV